MLEGSSMIHSIYPALSALRAFGQKLGVTANNIANINTNGFKKSRVDLEEASSSGVNASIRQVNTPGAFLPPDPDTGEPQESSNVSADEEVVSLITAKHAYTANLKTIAAEEETRGTLFDILDK
jgi:flagellar basal-body rod protein FlgC